MPTPAAARRATFRAALPLLALAAAFAACNGPRRIHEAPVLVNGARVPAADGAALGAAAAAAQQADRADADARAADAAAGCAGPGATADAAVCDALARGEVALGMREAQVYAASRAAPTAWSARRAGPVTTLVPAAPAAPPRDATAELALVQLVDGRVTSVTYREPQGLRVVRTPDDATAAGRARATAEALVREGDTYNAAGDRAGALDRYDRALALTPADAMLEYRVATLLDLQLRPVEARIRYQRFLQTLELERIDATGRANARLAEAIARAQQRVVVLERQTR